MEQQDLLWVLHWDILARIFAYVSVDDLGRLCCVCKSLYGAITQCNKLWRSHCKSVWLCSKLEEGCSSWKKQWLNLVREFGHYRGCYAEVKKTWTVIEELLAQYPSPSEGGIIEEDLSKSLRDGISEQDIAAAETELGFSLPKDLRCSLRFHDGQKSDNQASFLGCLEFYSFTSTLILYPLEMMVKEYCCSTISVWMKNSQYLRIASDQDGHFVFLLALEGCMFTPPGHVVQVSSVNWRHHAPSPEVFPNSQIIPGYSVGLIGEGRRFKDWLQDHAKALPFYPVLRNSIVLRFYCNPEWKLVTGHFTVQVGTALDPTLGTWSSWVRNVSRLLRQGSYAYFITIKMHEDAPQEERCQLLTRHWIIKYASGKEERVSGDGVIGENPIFSPGTVHQYASCTSFIDEKYSTMEGHYTMRYLHHSGTFIIGIPKFYMPQPKVVWA